MVENDRLERMRSEQMIGIVVFTSITMKVPVHLPSLAMVKQAWRTHL